MNTINCFKEFIKYSVLNVLGMIGLSCYILADTFFISKGLGPDGLTALNLAIPLYSFIHGSGLMIGMGGSIKYSILKSQNDTDGRNYIFTNAVLLALIFAIAFFLIGLFFSETMITLLGADETIFEMSKTYLRILLLFAPMFIMNNVLLCFVRNDGAPQHCMIAMLAGSLANIVLDYIFIFLFGMGIWGAALATGFSPVISMLILSSFFLKKKNHFHFKKCRPSGKLTITIFSNGLPSLITEVSSGIVIIVFNMIILRLEGNIGVAAYGIIANLSLVVISIYTGIAQGIQSLISSHYGSGNHSNVQSILGYALTAMLVISGIIYFCVFWGASFIASIFNSEQNTLLQSIAITGLKYYFTACLFSGFNIIMSVYFTSIGSVLPAHIISILRGFIIIIPMAFLLSSIGGMIGIWFAFPVTELIVSIIGITLYLVHKKHVSF
jgi:putative MATE family efflux protein